MAPIQLGVLMIPFQLSDVVMPLDVLSSSSSKYLELMAPAMGLTPSQVAQGLEVEYHYIGLEASTPSTHSAELKLVPTCTTATCPKIDYLLIGGPTPDYAQNVPEQFATFIRDRLPNLKAVFTTCTGSLVLAATGLLDGVTATVNHECIGLAQHMFPNVKWTKEKQWIVSGEGQKFWTAGGACAGMDMFAFWAMERTGKQVAEAGWAALDYEPRDVQGKLIQREFFGGRLGAAKA
jgi:transcriptional regulator GlxA family with amidase domain